MTALDTSIARVRCVVPGCSNVAIKRSRFCDKHRRRENRPPDVLIPPRFDAPPLKTAREVVESVREHARAHAHAAIRHLVSAMEDVTAEAPSRITAAKSILGIAGVSLSPSPSALKQMKLQLPASSLSLTEALALVREARRDVPALVAPVAPAPIDAMARLLPSGECVPGTGPYALTPGQQALIDGQYVESTAESPPIAPDGQEQASPSGSQPEGQGQEGQEGESDGKV